MKKILGIIILGLLLSGNILSAKTINIENKIQLDVPISHGFIKIDRDSALNSGALSGLEEFLDELDDLALNFYVVGPKQLTDVIKLLLDGENFEDMEIFQNIMRKAEKKANTSNFQDPRKMMSWIFKEIKKLMKKEKVEFYTYVITSDKKYTSIKDNEIVDFIDELLNMSNSELSISTKEIRKDITELAGDNKTILVNEEMSLIIKKFKIEKISNNHLVLNANFILDYLGAIKLPYNLSVVIKNDKIHFIASECWVNCSKQVKRFDKMIKPLFSPSKQVQETSESISANSNLSEQLGVLNELYKSGALTKEEFSKAKKKLLN